jgi:hypothetical protein
LQTRWEPKLPTKPSTPTPTPTLTSTSTSTSATSSHIVEEQEMTSNTSTTPPPVVITPPAATNSSREVSTNELPFQASSIKTPTPDLSGWPGIVSTFNLLRSEPTFVCTPLSLSHLLIVIVVLNL